MQLSTVQHGQARLSSATRRCPGTNARRLVAARAQTGTKPAAATRLPRWEDMWAYLVKERRMSSITPEDAQQRVQSGEYVLVDVRLKEDFRNSHPQGAVHAPMYQQIDMSEGADATKVIKTLFYRFNGVNPVEPNPLFMEQVQQIASSGKGLIFLCEAGGTLVPTTNFPQGKASRSLQAAFRVLTSGVTDKVEHLERGAYGWYQAGFDFEGDGQYKPDIGRTPNAAAEPTLKAIQDSVGYESKPGDKAVEQKNKFWPF